MTQWATSREIVSVDDQGRCELGKERCWRRTNHRWFGKRRWVRLPLWLARRWAKSWVKVA